jgi:hypothetical protein
MVGEMASHGLVGWLTLGGAVRRGWHGGAVSSTVLSGAPLLAPPSTRDWHLVQSFEVTDGTGVEVWMVLQG